MDGVIPCPHAAVTVTDCACHAEGVLVWATEFCGCHKIGVSVRAKVSAVLLWGKRKEVLSGGQENSTETKLSLLSSRER